MRKLPCLLAASLAASFVPWIHAQSADSKDLLLKKLTEQVGPTKFTADKTGIVKAGSAVALKKDGMLVYTVTVPAPPINYFKKDKDKLAQAFGDSFATDMVDGMGREGGAASVPRKTLVAGEKVWVSSIQFVKDSVQVQVITDPYDDGRYFGALKFPVAKGTIPTPEDALKAIGEVLEIPEPQEAPAQAAAPASPPAAAPVPAQPKYQEIAAPPPPPPPAPTVSVGMSKDQVIGGFGEPQRKAAVGAKEIFFYTDLKMKITFTNGKVSNVE